MMASPKVNDIAMIWYRQSNRHLPYHGKLCRIIIASKGTPRNHGVRVTGGGMVVVPCGNLRKYK
jgi:hypothetical protein